MKSKTHLGYAIEAIDELKARYNKKIAEKLLQNCLIYIGTGKNITTDILGKICKALDCSADDIMEFVFDEVDDGDRVE